MNHIERLVEELNAKALDCEQQIRDLQQHVMVYRHCAARLQQAWDLDCAAKAKLSGSIGPVVEEKGQ